MTIEEFNKTGWNANSKVIYKGAVLNVGSVDFEEKLIGTYDSNIDNNPNCNCSVYDWIRCENAELINIPLDI